MANFQQTFFVLCSVVFVLCGNCLCITFENAEFESTDYNGNWNSTDCKMSPSNDAYTGSHSVHIFDRTLNSSGLSQHVNLLGNKLYKIIFYVKLLSNLNNTMYQDVEVMVDCKDQHDYVLIGLVSNSFDPYETPNYSASHKDQSCLHKLHYSGKDVLTSFGLSPHVQEGVWYAVGGVNKLPAGLRSHTCRVYLQIEAPTEYLADHALLKEMTSDWKASADQRIDQLRKADVTIRLAGNHDSTTKVSVELAQQKQEFAFGSSIRVGTFNYDSYLPYQKVFLDTFEWVVFENSLKWLVTQPRQLAQQKQEFAFGSSIRVATFNYDYYLPYQKVFLDTFEWVVFENSLKWGVCQPRQDVQHYIINIKVLNIMRDHGIKVRGHTVFWSDEFYIQDWVKALNKTELLSEIDGRIDRVFNHTKGMMEHWNVNNEDINNDFFAQRTENPNITMEMFKKVHAVDSHPKLFLNEHSILTKCDKAVALMDKAKRFKDSGIPIGGIGVEGHLHDFDLTEIWERLNILGQAGVPVVISELAIHEKNATIKAQKLEDLLTLFFSHPSVEGVIFWGFWQDRYWETDADLFEGYGVTPNEAGKKLLHLLKTQWRTNEVGSLQGSQPWGTRVFKGDYRLDVKHNGQLIRTENITITGNGQTFDLNIDGVQNGHPHVSNIIVG